MISERASQRIFIVETIVLVAPTILIGVMESTPMTFSPIMNLLMRDPDQPLYGVPIIAAGALGLAACGSALYLTLSFLTGGAARLKRTSWLWWVLIAAAFFTSVCMLGAMGGFNGIAHGTPFGGLIMIAAMSGLLGAAPYLHLLAERIFRFRRSARI